MSDRKTREHVLEGKTAWECVELPKGVGARFDLGLTPALAVLGV